MLLFFTRTGKMKKADVPHRRNFLERLYRLSRNLGLGNTLRSSHRFIIFTRVRTADDAAEPKPVEQPWMGLPEAELTDEQEHEAQRRASSEWHRE